MGHEDLARWASRCSDGSPGEPLPGFRARRCPSNRTGHTSTHCLQPGGSRLDLSGLLHFHGQRARGVQQSRSRGHASNVRVHISADDAARTAFIGPRDVVRLFRDKDPAAPPAVPPGARWSISSYRSSGVCSGRIRRRRGRPLAPGRGDRMSHNSMAAWRGDSPLGDRTAPDPGCVRDRDLPRYRHSLLVRGAARVGPLYRAESTRSSVPQAPSRVLRGQPRRPRGMTLSPGASGTTLRCRAISGAPLHHAIERRPAAGGSGGRNRTCSRLLREWLS
jgi:hypothetical protein